MTFYTLEQFNVSESASPDANLFNINCAIAWSAAKGVPVYGLGKKLYKITASAEAPQLLLKSNATIICGPDCKFEYDYPNSFSKSSIVGGEPSLANARWSGGTFQGSTTGGAPPNMTVFDVVGDDLLFEDITIRQFAGGTAMTLAGDRIRVIDANIANKGGSGYPLDLGGIAFNGGDAFLCQDPMIDVSGNALLITCLNAAKPTRSVRCLGANLRSNAFGALVIRAALGVVQNVRIDGLIADGASINTRLTIESLGLGTPDAGDVSNIVVRDAFITAPAPPASGTNLPFVVDVRNGNAGSKSRMSAILLNNLVIRCSDAGANVATNAVMRVSSQSDNRLDGFTWLVGGIACASVAAGAGFPHQYLLLRGFDNGTFKGLTLDQGRSLQPIMVGDTARCTGLVFADVVMTRIASGATGVTFDNATACGWVRGAISGAASGAQPVAFTAANLTGNSVGCFVEDADLSVNAQTGDRVTVAKNIEYRLTGNRGSTQRSAVGLGTAIVTTVDANGAISARSGFLLLGPNNTVLKLITPGGSQAGDVLVLMAQSGSVTVSEPVSGVGNIALSQPTIVLGATGRDTLTLLYRGISGAGVDLGWVQVATSDNG